MKIGIAGMGRMGTAMAQRLIDQGHEVCVWNRTREKTRTAADAGAAVAQTAAALAREAQVVITMLTNAQAVHEVYEGRDGLFSGDIAGKTFVDMSTVRGVDHAHLEPLARSKNAHFLECPVSGTVKPARDGVLVGFAGGSVEAFDAAKPALASLCRRVELVGPIGAGANLKLAANLILTVFWQSLGEAVSLMRGLPIPPQRVVELLADSNVASGMLKLRAPAVAAALEGAPAAPAAFDIDYMRKDLRDMLAEAESLGLDLPAAAQTLRCFDGASQSGAGGIDGTRYPAWWVAHDRVRSDGRSR